MRNDTAILEVMPMGFAGMFEGYWAKIFYANTAKTADFRVRYFALHIEDPKLSRPSEYEEADFSDPTLWARDRSALVFSSCLSRCELNTIAAVALKSMRAGS
jgi:hypothetical protein